jgi:pyrroloquinoline quinone biosynthesis protein E
MQVHSDTVLTSKNWEEIYEVGRKAKELGMSVLFVNIYQPAGIGAHFEDKLAPSVAQIRGAITQMLKVRDNLGLDVRFGTSTPYCLDERLVTEGLAFTCGTGTWFGSVSPLGDFRICNQSGRSYGNILERPLHEIWHAREMSEEYRELGWLGEPCRSCVFRDDCLGGCRVNDKGVARLDPLLSREPESLLAQKELVALKAAYDNSKQAAYAI